jgi:hypothetical protein
MDSVHFGHFVGFCFGFEGILLYFAISTWWANSSQVRRDLALGIPSLEKPTAKKVSQRRHITALSLASDAVFSIF